MSDKITEQLRTLQDAVENPSGEWAQFRSRPAPTVEPVAAATRLMSACERLANTPIQMSLTDWGECAASMQEAATALATAQARIAGLEKALGEFAEPRNWVVNGRFDPHSGNFDATTFARAALTGGEDDH